MSQLYEMILDHREQVLSVIGTALVVAPLVWWRARGSFLKSRDAYVLLSQTLAAHQIAMVRIYPAVGRVLVDRSFTEMMGWQYPLNDLKSLLVQLSEDERTLCLKVLEREYLHAPSMVWQSTHGRYIQVSPVHGSQRDNVVTWLCRDITDEYAQTLSLQAERDMLKDLGRRYASILNHMDDLVWMRDDTLQLHYCNVPYMHAVAVEEGEQEEDLPIGHIPELSRQGQLLAKKAKEQGRRQSEKRYVVVSGKRCYMDISENWDAELGMSIGFARNITELGNAEEEVSRYRSLLNDLLESSTSGVAVFGADFRLKFYNQAYARMWGLGEIKLDQQPVFGEVLEILRENRKLPEQANFAAFKKQQLRVFTDLLMPEEEFFYLPDGRTLRNVKIPHAMGGVLLTYEDVTDRLALERSYNTLIAVQRETLDNLHEGVIVFGEDGKVRLSNPVFRVLWELRESDVAQGTHITTVLDTMKPLFVAEEWAEFKRELMLQVQSRRLLASRTNRTDGKVLEWSCVPLPDGGTLLTYVNITDSTLVEMSLLEKNEALQAADKLKSEFLANVSYELRSPLTSISGFAEMLNMDYFGKLSDKQKEYVDGIYHSSQQLMYIVNDILDLASIEAGYMKLEISEFNILEMIQSVLLLVVERAKQMNIHLNIQCPETIGMIHADEKRIRQVLFHLVSNAMKFSPEHGTVEVGAMRGKDGLLLWVQDDGVGMDLLEQQHVFDKFYRGKNGARKSGTGLGLSMVRSFIDLHGGSVSVESPEQKGARFTCLIPYNSAAIQHREADDETQAKHERMKKSV